MKRGLVNMDAIILNSFDYGESDRILTFFTRQYGKVKGIAKGARRSRKRFVGNLEPASNVRLIVFHSDKSELVRVEDCALIEGFHELKSDIEMLGQACYTLELVCEMTREGQALPGVYELLLGALAALAASEGEALRFFEIRLLSKLGFLPHLDGCVVCRKTEEEGRGRVYFSSDKGGLVCGACSKGGAGLLAVSTGTARLLSMAARLDAEKLKRLKPGAIFLEESEKLLYDFIKFQIGKELKTKSFMTKMKRAGAAAP